jgi:acylphosphatase
MGYLTPSARQESAMERRRIRFTGRVQGVGFRATARGIANMWPVTGWVRNEADGSVLMEVQGEGVAIEAFIGALRSRMGRRIHDEESASMPVETAEGRFLIQP